MTQGILRRYDTLIFDWDGTLTTVKVLRKLNEELNPHWRYKKRKSIEHIDKYSVSMPKDTSTAAGKAIMRHIKEKGAENSLLSMLTDASFYFLRPKLHNDSIEVLEKLKRRKAKIALFTNGASYRILKELKYLKVEDYFTAIESAQDLNALKPNPLGLNVLVWSLRSKKERSIYIGDMVSDIEAAKYAGIDSCAIANGFDTYDQLRSARPTYLLSSMEALKKAL